MAWGVNNVDVMRKVVVTHPFPKTGGRSRSNGNAALLLLLHPIHDGSAIMHLTNLVAYTGIKKNAFSRHRFTGVNMRTNTDVTIAFNRSFTSHSGYLLPLILTNYFRNGNARRLCWLQPYGALPVSYTHLTEPTRR